ncbi:MAG: FABP family protein [Bifidobacteriaceae bacterium]|jgi:hypothetical protein|nr:FABP family protein [Bifidobacteriaceae bacterium]
MGFPEVAAKVAPEIAPEVQPLAWLVGTWRGEGTIGYGPISPGRITQEVEFKTADGPYLGYRARTWLSADQSPTDQSPTEQQPPTLWHEEAGFWRVAPGQDAAPWDLEVLISDAAGYQSLYLGQVERTRVNLATDAVVRTVSAPEINAATRMYGLVDGDLLWAWDIAGFGHELGSYTAARLEREENRHGSL